ncbi:transcriptional regulator [Terrihabitans soli]|uniref:Transcriptional regulator n=1 Tax=Terrihabitans soli TaxID=708113 RepID=A0A6S6QJX4_9HYPH|nr:AraC family transcriptional regulator [Terrihabitans soli]BCJ90614.1 transcriptional regulator [Terrihabitans soli]
MDTHIELAKMVEQYSSAEGMHPTAIPRLHLIRSSTVTEPLHALHVPAVCLIAQGRKQVMLGPQLFEYDPAKYLVVAVDAPIVAHVTQASADKPYLCVRLDLDPTLLGQLMLEAGTGAAPNASVSQSLQLSTVTPELVDAFVRLVKLLGQPKDIPVLAPLAEREILYRLLLGEQGERLKQIAVAESKVQQVNRAIGWIKKNYREPFSIESVAAEARMSASALHAHFKAVTAMSPLQYQKQLRLQEARRLLLINAADAATAGHRVGYDSPSQFSREYARTFGLPPVRDIARMKSMPPELLGLN